MELNGERFWSFVHSIQSPADILSGTHRTSNGIAIDLECRYRQTIVKTADSYEVVAPPEHRILKVHLLVPLEIPDTLVEEKEVVFDLIDTLENSFFQEPYPSQIQVGKNAARSNVEQRMVTFYFPLYVEEPSSPQGQAYIKAFTRSARNSVRAAFYWLYSQNTIIAPGFTPMDDDVAVTVVENVHWGGYVSYGRLESGFDFGIFMDKDYAIPTQVLRMGWITRVKATWRDPVLDMKFYIENCEYKCKEDEFSAVSNSLHIVKDTCYSETVEAILENENQTKVVSNTSKFSFRSFMFENGGRVCELSCSIKTCLIGEVCVTPISCDFPGMEFMKFSLNGLNLE